MLMGYCHLLSSWQFDGKKGDETQADIQWSVNVIETAAKEKNQPVDRRRNH